MGFHTKYISKITCRLVSFSFCLILAAAPSFGSLGDDVSSVRSDQAHINASLRTSQTSAYSVDELQTPTGTVIREFASPAGRIFAVSWQGSSLPDLQQLLGAHFEDFQRAVKAQNRRPVGGPLYVQQNGLVVEIGGHMRSIRGRAYLPDEVPAGVRVEDLP
ncbi:MAG TPA: DUF2844 domain-containing protein [Candidatus Sulfotelmatobacter sp.]|nr:DUF2844 domain-containing protein [Candidatus Sulfotelmatobacter sp.]